MSNLVTKRQNIVKSDVIDFSTHIIVYSKNKR